MGISKESFLKRGATFIIPFITTLLFISYDQTAKTVKERGTKQIRIGKAKRETLL